MSPAPATAPTRSGFVKNPNHIAALREVIGVRLVKGTDKVTQKVQALLNEPGLGEHHPGEPNPSSQPGDAPASQSGDLAASQTTHGPIQRPDRVVAASGSDLPQALWLQLGTARILPRPYQRSALLASQSEVLGAMAGDGADGGAG